MASLTTWAWAASGLSFAAGAIATLAVTKVVAPPRGLRDPGDLPGFEERFVREFGVPDSKRPLVRSILRDYREKRRAIEGEAVAVVHDKLERAGREADVRLRGVLPPTERQRYDAWLDAQNLDKAPAGR